MDNQRVGDQITILIHGTFANPKYLDPDVTTEADEWWKISESEEGRRTTADRLQAALVRSDERLAGTVWRPGPLDPGVSYHSLTEWSGLNKHRVRKRAGRRLAESLERLAEGRGHDEDNPLMVNFVAHSHGGNVVLEALRKPPKNIRVGEVAMLGTPLVWRFYDPRIFYLCLIFFAIGYNGWRQLRSLEVTPEELAADPTLSDIIERSLSERLLALFVSSVLLFWLGVLVISLFRWITTRVYHGRPTYGPKPQDLRETLDGRSASLFISTEDEASLMMRLGAAPMDAYRALLSLREAFKWERSVLSRLLKYPFAIVERLVLRPFVYVVLAPLLELLLERFGLGFPARTVAVANQQMITWSGSTDRYEGAVALSPVSSRELRRAQHRYRLEDEKDVKIERHHDEMVELALSLSRAARGLSEQVKLSHSGYYRSDFLINDVAARIARVVAKS